MQPAPALERSSLPAEEHIHFRCAFDIEGASPTEVFCQVSRAVRKWVASRLPRDAAGQLKGDWFTKGGRKQFGVGAARLTVETAAASGASGPNWAMRMDHPDRDFQPRVWRAEVGLTQTERGARVTAIVAHRLWSEFVGPAPPPPKPSSPRIVKDLLESFRGSAKAGGETVRAEPTQVFLGRANEFVARLHAPDRSCPIVYLSRCFASGDPLVDPRSLAALAGC